jgi:hypothetical protein
MISKDDLARKYRCSVSFVEKAIRGERDSPRANEIREYWETHQSRQMQLVNDMAFIDMMTFVIEKSGKFDMINRAMELQGLAAEQLGISYKRAYTKKQGTKLKRNFK